VERVVCLKLMNDAKWHRNELNDQVLELEQVVVVDGRGWRSELPFALELEQVVVDGHA
jgi:ERCC4-type nuclease